MVVGTTTDYIKYIEKIRPGECLFLTDVRERQKNREPLPLGAQELVCDLLDVEKVILSLNKYLDNPKMILSGVVCFDCESMHVAARIAQSCELPFPGIQAVASCRSKTKTKQLWRDAGVSGPKAGLIRSAMGAVSFYRGVGGAVVLKPLTGSGSELTFLCHNEKDCRRNFNLLKESLKSHHDVRMYAPILIGGVLHNPREIFSVEEFIQGEEYSCDFILDNGDVDIIRIAKKIKYPGKVFGITQSYIIPADLPEGISLKTFKNEIANAAHALDLNRTMGMIDFFFKDGKICFLEMTPRPGGDCLPQLIFRSSGFDMVAAALDFSRGRRPAIPPLSEWKRMVAVRIFSSTPGCLRRLDASRIQADPRVREVSFRFNPGHLIVLPPENLDSWLLGYVIFEPGSQNIEEECRELSSKVIVEVEAPQCPPILSS